MVIWPFRLSSMVSYIFAAAPPLVSMILNSRAYSSPEPASSALAAAISVLLKMVDMIWSIWDWSMPSMLFFTSSKIAPVSRILPSVS